MASGNTVVSFTLRAIDRASSAIRRIGSAVAGVAKGLLSQGANIQGWVSLFQGAAGRIQGIFSGLWGAIRESFKFETLTGQFRTLLGSTEAAEERMAMLARVAEETPFDLEGVVKANRTLSVMSGDALGTREALLLVGDTAAATGGQVEELAFWVGRAYAMIKGGQPFGEAAMRLSELGAITPEVRQKMEALQAAGAGSAEVWQVLQGHLATFSGAMAHLSQTGDGLTATLGDTWSASVRQFGDAFQGAAKDSIAFLIKLLQKLQADGTIQRWAEAAVKALTPVKNLIQAVLGGDGETRGEALKAAWDYVKSVANYVKTVVVAAFDYAGTKMRAAALGAAAEIAGAFGFDSSAAVYRKRAEATNDLARLTFQRTLLEAGQEVKAAGARLSQVTSAAAERAKARVSAAAETATEPLQDDGGLTKATEDLKAADARRKEAAQTEADETEADETEADETEEEAARKRKEAAQAAIRLAEEEKRKAEAKLAEARKRATDSDYERETRQREERERKRQERERKRQEREERRLRRRGERLLRQFATVGDPNALLREDFDVKRLGHGQRRVREWLMAQQSAKEVTLRADGMITLLKQNTENLKYIRDDLKRLLTQA